MTCMHLKNDVNDGLKNHGMCAYNTLHYPQLMLSDFVHSSLPAVAAGIVAAAHPQSAS